MNQLAETICGQVARMRARKTGRLVADEVADAVKDALAFQRTTGREVITAACARRPDATAMDIETCFRIPKPVAYTLVAELGWFSPGPASPAPVRQLTAAQQIRELRALVIDASVRLTRLDRAEAEAYAALAAPVMGDAA